MKTLNDYVVAGALYQGGTGPEAQVGDQVVLYLNTEANPAFPDSIIGVIQHPIAKVQCNEATSYDIEYDETDIDGAAAFIRPDDVVDSEVFVAATLFIPPTSDPLIAGAVWNNAGTLTISAG